MLSSKLLKPKFRLVTFDVTNTLLGFNISVGEQYSKIGDKHGVQCNPTSLQSSFKTHYKAMAKEHPNFGCFSGMTSQEWWKIVVTNSFLSVQPRATNMQLTNIANSLYELYCTTKCWKVHKDVVQQLKLLQQHDVKLGVISNFDDRLDRILLHTGLKEYFDFILCSFIEHVEKPDKKIFDLALSRVQLPNITASEAVHFGDDLECDYLAAKNAGWSAYLLRHSNEPVPGMEGAVITAKDILHCLLR